LSSYKRNTLFLKANLLSAAPIAKKNFGKKNISSCFIFIFSNVGNFISHFFYAYMWNNGPWIQNRHERNAKKRLFRFILKFNAVTVPCRFNANVKMGPFELRVLWGSARYLLASLLLLILIPDKFRCTIDQITARFLGRVNSRIHNTPFLLFGMIVWLI
jgi:hypothetical protein